MNKTRLNNNQNKSIFGDSRLFRRVNRYWKWTLGSDSVVWINTSVKYVNEEYD